MNAFTILEARLAGLDAFIRESMQTNDVKGLTCSVIHRDEVIYQGYFGYADPASGRMMDASTHVEAASLTKPLFAYVVNRLANAGGFDLDRPLVTFPVPPPTDDPRIRLLTARQVLSHASGLPNWGSFPLRMRFTPGHGFGYSGEGFTYLQRVIEHVTGKRLDHLLQDEVFNPLAIEDATLVWTSPLNRTLAVAHDATGKPEPLRSSVYHRIGYYEPNAAFSLYATAGVYPRFLTALVDEAYAEQVRLTDNPAAPEVSWGLGWGKFHDALWHWGDNGGYKSFVGRNAAVGDGFVVHTNSHSGLRSCQDIASYITDTDFTPIFSFIDTAE